MKKVMNCQPNPDFPSYKSTTLNHSQIENTDLALKVVPEWWSSTLLYGIADGRDKGEKDED